MADNWLRGDYVADNQTFEAHLNTLRSGDGGVILTATQTGHEFFSRWNTTVDEYAQQHACIPESRRTILETVIAKYFAGGVQQWLAPIMSRAENIQQLSNELENLLGQASPVEYDLWRQQRDGYIRAMKSLTVAHVKALKRVINPC
jgi:hypothetical protein